jgi:hypothetical protein
MAASPNSLLATCAATGGREQSSEAGKDGVTSAAIDYEDQREGDRGGASVDAFP